MRPRAGTSIPFSSAHTRTALGSTPRAAAPLLARLPGELARATLWVARPGGRAASM